MESIENTDIIVEYTGNRTPGLNSTEHDNQLVKLVTGRTKEPSSAILIFTSCFYVAAVEVTVENESWEKKRLQTNAMQQ